MLQPLLLWQGRQSGKWYLSFNVQVLHNRLLNVGREIEMFYLLLRSAYFFAKNRIPHTTVYPHLVNLEVANGDNLLEQHIKQNPSNAQYSSKFSVTMLIEAIDTWLERKLLTSLMSSPFFSILADECQDIYTQEELSICCRWIVNGCPEEHFLTVLRVKSTDAESITDTLTSLLVRRILTTGSW